MFTTPETFTVTFSNPVVMDCEEIESPSPLAAKVDRWETLTQRIRLLTLRMNFLKMAIDVEHMPGVVAGGHIFQIYEDAEWSLSSMRRAGRPGGAFAAILDELDRQAAAAAEARRRAGFAEMEHEINRLRYEERAALEAEIEAAPMETPADVRAKADYGFRLIVWEGDNPNCAARAHEILGEIAKPDLLTHSCDLKKMH
ncbi:MAG: hypothetical protein CMJ42_08110 [Phyllobacteriaceae bacterium]|nr:hypothetical protein [Phyllobacteriaceae bacterium]MBA89732.1 hypothetical protein [Phyllobacteriaceae bacterium]